MFQIFIIYRQDESLLTHCIKLQNMKAVDVLLKCGASPNQPSKKGVTPISAASHKGNVLIMQVLIDSGANVNAVNNSGSTALIQVMKILSIILNIF